MRLHIWPKLTVTNETLNRLVFTLRQKLLSHKNIIVTHHGQGYRLNSGRDYSDADVDVDVEKASHHLAYNSHLMGGHQLGKLGPDHTHILAFVKGIMGFRTEANLVAAARTLDDWHISYPPHPETLVARAEISITSSILGYSKFNSAFSVGWSAADEAEKLLSQSVSAENAALSNYAAAIKAWFEHLDGAGQNSILARLQHAAERFPKDHRISFLLGWGLTHSGKILGALDALENAIKLLGFQNKESLTDNGCECLRAAILLAMGDAKNHHAVMVQLERKYPYSSWGQYISASYLLSIGDLNGADTLIQKWRSIDYFSRKWAYLEAAFRKLTNDEFTAINIIDNDSIVHKYKPHITAQIYPELLLFGTEKAAVAVLSATISRCPGRIFSKIDPNFALLYSALPAQAQSIST